MRKGDKPLPENIQDFLTAEQLNGLRRIESFGWQLKFIRRPRFQKTVAVVISPESNAVGVLENDGRLNLEPEIVIRS